MEGCFKGVFCFFVFFFRGCFFSEGFFFKCFSLLSEASLSSLLEFRCIFSNGFVFFFLPKVFFQMVLTQQLVLKVFSLNIFSKKKNKQTLFLQKKFLKKKGRLVVTKNDSF